MSHAVAGPPVTVSAPSFGRLVLVEVRRFFARRAIRVLLALLVIGYLLMIGIAAHHFHQVTAADRARAVATRDDQVKRNQQGHDECVRTTAKDQVDEECGPPVTATDFNADDFLTVRAMTPNNFTDLATVLGVGTAAIGFLVGATFIGAEWSSRNIVPWLFWEPRRLRLLGAKALAVLSVLLAISAVLQVSWAVVGRFLLSRRGTPFPARATSEVPSAHQADLTQLRLVLLVLATTLLAFGIAQLLRTSTAAFGFGFLYFAVLETAVRALKPHWQPYLLTDNIVAWVQRRGLRIFFDHFDRRTGQYSPYSVHISNLRGAITILIYVGVVVAAAVATFRRRDIA